MNSSLEWGMVSALWSRDVLRLKKERSRWFGVVLQPLIFWIVIGSGMSRGFTPAVAGGDNYLKFFFPGTIVLSILFTTIFSVITIIEDRSSGFLQAVLVAPGSRTSLVLGKIAGVSTIVFLQVFFFLLVAPLAGFPLSQVAWLPLLAVVVLGCVSLTALNFAMAWILNSSQAYHAVMSIILIPLWIMSGAMFPLKETWMEYVMAINPIKYLVDGFRATMSGSIDSSFSFTLSMLALFSVVFVALSVMVLRKTRGEAA